MAITRSMLTFIVVICTLLISVHGQASNQSEVVSADNVKWGYLNPLRGDKSPGAAELWGDRTKNTATGMLVRFKQGFSSPPHIHNITYRGVVIRGLLHNDDPKALPMWMPTGSFWTQPAGADHTTAANGEDNLIYLEIDSGPYLVHPSKQQFQNDEHPLNLHASNLVWLDQSQDKSISDSAAEIAYLWGNTNSEVSVGALLKLPGRFKGNLSTNARELRAVVISGSVGYTSTETASEIDLAAGSYFGSKGKFKHQITTEGETVVYLRSNGSYALQAIKP